MLSRQGKTAPALDAYQKSLDVFQKLADADPGNTDWQRDLDQTYDRIGDLFVTLGKRTAALDAYQKANAVAKKLGEKDPGNARWQTDIAINYVSIGDVTMKQGNLTQALDAFEQNLAIIQKLASNDPGNESIQVDLASSYQKVGDVLAAQGKTADAIANFQKTAAIHKALSGKILMMRPWCTTSQSATARSAICKRAKATPRPRSILYRQGLAIIQKLADADPTNAALQQDLAASFEISGRAGYPGK